MQRKNLVLCIAVGLFIIDFIVAAIGPVDRFVWAFYVALPVLLLLVLAATFRWFKFSAMVYWLLLFMCFMFFYAGHYTLPEVPFGQWMKCWFGFERNNYDRLLLLAFGFFSSIAVRELIIRKTALKKGKMLFFLVVCVLGAGTVLFLFAQWWASYFVSDATYSALAGAQGDVWYAQWDMTMAFAGAILGQACLMHLNGYFLKDEGLLEQECPKRVLKTGGFSNKRHK